MKPTMNLRFVFKAIAVPHEHISNVANIKTAKVLDLHRDGSSGLTTLTGAADEIFRFQETNISMSEI